MHHWARLLSLSLLIYLSPAKSDDPEFPKLRDIAQTFESSVELTDQIQKTTALAKEYYDFGEQTGRAEVLALGQKFNYFFNGKTKQVYTVNDTACSENDAGVAELSFSFYRWTFENPLFVGPSALIMTVENNPPKFSNKTSTRGIECDWFHSETSKDDKNLTLDFYFSVPEWDMPFHQGANVKRYPIRIIISFISADELHEETIDYLYFRPKLNDKSKLQPPVGLGCSLREPTVKPPVIPDQYTFSIEGFDLLSDSQKADTDVTTATFWYDFNEKVGRMDQYTAKGKISEVHDFKTATRYRMRDDRTCVYETMRNSLFMKFPLDSEIGQMKEPEEFFNLQGDEDTYYSLGQDEVRGIKCNVLEKVEPNVLYLGRRYSSLVTTVYLTTDSTKIQVDGEDLDFNPPLKVITTGYEQPNIVTLKEQYQIFSFDDEPGREFFSTFPSDECFPASNMKSYFVIMIAVPIEIATAAEKNSTVFTELARNTIINTANITEFRLPFVRADYRESGIYLTGLMLDRPSLLDHFWKFSDEKTYVTTISAYVIDIDASTEEACAAACLNYVEPCKGFHFCGEACVINLGELTDEPVDNEPLNLDCYIYIRAVSDSRNDQASLEQALQSLENATEKKQLKFSVPITGKLEIVTATSVVKSFNKRGGDDINSYPYTLVKAGFQFKKDSETTVEAPDGRSEQDCYRQCKENTFIACSSFSYCSSTKTCFITSVLLNGGPKDSNEIEANAKCDIFSLLYLDLFDQYPGKVLDIPGKKVVEDAYSAEECAKTCKEETSFKCRGFEYCRSLKGSCVLHEKHVLDLSGTTTAKTECIHYAAKFSADYRDMGLLLIDDESNRREDMTLEECARACSEEMPSCKSFNYCPPSETGASDSSCSMTTQTLYDAKTKTKEKCHLYTKRENIEDWSPQSPKTKKSGYTSGGFAGLLIGMIILGLVVGALIFVGYSFFRSRRGGGDGLTVKFSKQDNM